MRGTFPTLLLLASLLTCTSSAGGHFRPAANQGGAANGPSDEIPTISFCKMLSRPQLYFDKPVRLAATYRSGYETAYLIDDQCALSHRVKIGIGFNSASQRERDVIRKDVDKIMSGIYGNGRARVLVVGLLRNLRDRVGFGGYRYRFDIMRFEDISREDASHTIINYEGTLQAGKVYRATVRGDRQLGLSLTPPLRVPIHHAWRVEWINLSRFRALLRLRDSSREQQVVFSVISDEIKPIAERRWNRTLRCEVLMVE